MRPAGGAGRGFVAAQDGADAGGQFARVERLRQVIVGAEFQADDAVDIFAARGQHDDRDFALLAQAAQDFEAVDARQHDVEHDEVDARVRRRASRPRLPSCSHRR